MKVVILAGGRGTRISEESGIRPKPMVEIGDFPVLWHIMKIYSHYGYNDFVICLGYKGNVIKEYFDHYYRHMSEVITYDYSQQPPVKYQVNKVEPWKVTLVDTGLETLTASRIAKVKPYLDSEPFMLTYGDGLANVNINKLVDSHHKSGKIVTITGVQPDGRFGRLELENNDIIGFTEKVKGDGGWINGGFMVMNQEVFQYIDHRDDVVLEKEPLQNLAKDRQLNVYKHENFWQPMDTLREKIILDQLWKSNNAPWKIWSN